MIDICPECGSSNLRHGSDDPMEGSYYWCADCKYGPILYPLYYRIKFIPPVFEEWSV